MSYSAAEFLAANRGGGLFSESISQRIGSYIAVAAHRLGLAPTTLTLLNLIVALIGSVGVVISASRIATDANAWWIGLGALLLWHLAYSLDCADGQLARVTGQASAAGGRVDILSDIAVQIGLITAISTVAMTAVKGMPLWLVGVFCGTWLVNLMTSILSSGPASASLLTSKSLIVRIIKLVRDFAAMVTVCGLAVAFAPGWLPWVMAGFSVTNGAFLLLSIAQAAAAAYRGDGKLAVPPSIS